MMNSESYKMGRRELFWSLFVYFFISSLYIISPRIPGKTGDSFLAVLVVFIVLAYFVFQSILYESSTNRRSINHHFNEKSMQVSIGLLILTILIYVISLFFSIPYSYPILMIGLFSLFVILFLGPLTVGCSCIFFSFTEFAVKMEEEKVKGDFEDLFASIYLTSLYSICLFSTIFHTSFFLKTLLQG